MGPAISTITLCTTHYRTEKKTVVLREVTNVFCDLLQNFSNTPLLIR